MAKASLLTALFVKQVREPGVYRDGQGLVLRVFESGAKRWVLRVTARGRRRDVGLGAASEVSLAEARERAAERRKDVRDGRDPVAAQRAARTSIPTFRDAAEQEYQRRCKGWRDGKHRGQWINTLRQHAFPKIGDRLVSDVTMADVLEVLTPIWQAKAETARRVRQRIRIVLERARVAGQRDGINPADAVGAALQKQPRRARHHAAVPYAEVPALLRRLQASNGDGLIRLALEFTILTAMRTGEVLGARWEEIDLAVATWTIPAERMKVEAEHRVPLSDRCIEISGLHVRWHPRVTSCSRVVKSAASHSPTWHCSCTCAGSAAVRRCTASAVRSATGRRRQPTSRGRSARPRSRTKSRTASSARTDAGTCWRSDANSCRRGRGSPPGRQAIPTSAVPR